MLNELLQTCNETLLDLRIGKRDFAPMHWPPQHSDTLSFPMLRRLDLNLIRLHTWSLAEYLAAMSNLKELTVRHCRRVSWDDVWQSLFKAIREHANKVHVEFKKLRVESDNVAETNHTHYIDLHLPSAESLISWTDEGPVIDDAIPFSEAQSSLTLYLLGKGDWDDTLQRNFEVP